MTSQSPPSSPQPSGIPPAALCALGGFLSAAAMGLVAYAFEIKVIRGFDPSAVGVVIIAAVVGGLCWCLAVILAKLLPISGAAGRVAMLGLGLVLAVPLLFVCTWWIVEVMRWAARR